MGDRTAFLSSSWSTQPASLAKAALALALRSLRLVIPGLIVLIAPAAHADESDELQIEAADITSEDSNVLLANKAVLRYRSIVLRANKLRYDSKGGWARAFDGITLTDRQGNKLYAETLEYFPLLTDAVARGRVEFVGAGGLELVADLIRYDLDSSNLLGEGSIVLRDANGNELTTEQVSYNVARKEGAAQDVLITSPHHPGQLAAATARVAPYGYRLEEATYTTCDRADPAWILEADSLTVDENEVVTARHATLRMFGLPVLYLPELSFINSDERRSGFLAPSFTYRSGSELSIETPFYLNLAPNYDALITPRLTSGRGVYAELSGRWLFANARGDALVGYTSDRASEQSRGRLAVNNRQRLADRWNLELAGEWVSDDAFPDDYLLGDQAAQRQYQQRLQLEYARDDLVVGAKLLKFQTILQDDEVAKPFASLPGLYLNWATSPAELAGSELGVDASIDYFTRGGADPQEGLRSHANVKLSRTDWLGNTRMDSQLGVAGSRYGLNGSEWATGYAQLQWRKPLATELKLAGGNLRQVIEPRLALGLVTEADFTGVPLYDTARAELSANELYRIDSYNGADRFEDTNLLAYGVSMRMLGKNRLTDVFTASFAQRYRFADSKISLDPKDEPAKRGFSNMVIEGKVRPSATNAFKGRLEWNPDLDKFEQVDIEAQLLPTNANVYAMQYTKNLRDDAAKRSGVTNLSFYRALGGQWRMTGDITYDLDDSRFTKVQSGLRYLSTCRCWNMDFFAEREPLAEGDRTYYYFQLSLLGLGSLGSDRFDRKVERLRKRL